jgi:23S rRNA (guanosine2251-2'-O)-methyltransferase
VLAEPVRTEIVYGQHAVSSVLERDPAGVLELWIAEARRDARAERLAAHAAQAGIAVHRAPRRTLDRLADGARHQGVVARYRATHVVPETDIGVLLAGVGPDTLLLVLDEVHDPHNLGACLRSAAAAGVDAVIVPRARAAALTGAARKVASGGAEAVPLVRVANIARALSALTEAGVRVVGADASASTSLYDEPLTGPLALVLGGEAKGLRRLTRERCDAMVHIPTSGAVASLNVSVAAGVILFETRRQRRAALA